MSFFKVCPHCGAALDPCEVCDCQNEEAARGAANTTDGKAETNVPDSASIMKETEGKIK